MPRKAPTEVIEHRISFSDKERKQIEELFTISKTKVAVDGVTATLQAVGGALAGGGMFWASLGLVAWFGGGKIIDAAKSTTEKVWGFINDEIAEPFVGWALEDSLVFDADKWRAINKEDQLRMDLAQADLDRYGNPASQYYDEQKALVAHRALIAAIELRDANNVLEFEERQRVRRVYSDMGFEEVYSPNEIALQLAYEERLRAWVEGGSQGDPPPLPDLSRANN